jgi:outer membrane lipopolysaccharide assembly protein LptE/RlpB
MRPPRARSSRLFLPLGLGLALAFVSGCGYTLSSVIPGHIKTIAIPVFQNSTVEFGIAEDVTRALQDAFLANGRLTTAGEKQADSVLRGVVLTYRNQVYGYSQQERATSYEIVLTVRVTFRDLVKSRDIWKEDALTVRTTYNVVTLGSEPARTETEARAEVVRKLADQIVSRTVQGW